MKEKELTLEECFNKIRELVNYDFIEEDKKYALHLLEVAKNDKNLELWIESYYKMVVVFKTKYATKVDEKDLDNLLWNNYQLGFFNGFNRGLEQVARGMLEFREKYLKKKVKE